MQNNQAFPYPFNSGTGVNRNPSIPYTRSVDSSNAASYSAALETTSNLYGRFGSAPVTTYSMSNGNAPVFTLGGQYNNTFNYHVGDVVCMSGITNVTAGFINGYCATISAASGTTVTLSIPGNGASTSGGTAGGYLTPMGSWYELVLFRDMPVNIELDVSAQLQGSSNTSMATKIKRTLVNHGGTIYVSAQGQDSVTGSTATPFVGPGTSINASVTPQSEYYPATTLISDPIYTDTATATGTGTCAGSSLTVTNVTGTITPGVSYAVYGVGILPGTLVFSGSGPYTLNQPCLSSSTAVSFVDGTVGTGVEVLFDSPSQQTIQQSTSSGQVVSIVNGYINPLTQGYLRQVSVGDYVTPGVSYAVSGVSGIGTTSTVITLSSYPTPFFQAGQIVNLQNFGGTSNINCNLYAGDYYRTITAANSSAHTITFDGTNTTGTYTSGGTVAQTARVLDVVDNWNFTTDIAFNPIISSDSAAYTQNTGAIAGAKVRILVRPVNSSGIMIGKIKMLVQGNPYQVTKVFEQP